MDWQSSLPRWTGVQTEALQCACAPRVHECGVAHSVLYLPSQNPQGLPSLDGLERPVDEILQTPDACVGFARAARSLSVVSTETPRGLTLISSDTLM
ncbi:hypothetical protein AAFF_G00272670 [Aldrovandia affinis]|uniref:Uncharacterized protein n=1 Tax=Aldrovandia affinis TaxID=143900 RepID=A0AAD7RAK4_9TELE|nr:hypothetical protein AAFF_G00272670 [Aldrovandia affinis]